MGKFFMHRIQKDNGTYTAGIEVHDTLDAAVLSFWGRMKTAYNNASNPTMQFVSCKVTDENGSVIGGYNLTWIRSGSEGENKYFLHHIRLDGETYNKGIDVSETFDAARSAFAAQMEYGYNNGKFPNVKMVSCEITNSAGFVLQPFAETWTKPEEEPVGE